MYCSRKVTRIKGYDYAKNGIYFLTVCSYNKENIFGRINNNKCILNTKGKILESIILSTADKYPSINIHNYVIMPNHFHLLIEIDNSLTAESFSIVRFIRIIKSTATVKINSNESNPARIVFQRSFHDHIVRNKEEYKIINEYIETNPYKWNSDRYFIE